ncbi:MAG: hypothetical protein ACTSP3_06325 [Candidatus Heimdallarchaeaceae archaeon]
MKKLTDREKKIIIGAYCILVGLAIILVWIIFYGFGYVSLIGMEKPTLISHLVAELVASVLSVIAGILLVLNLKMGDYLFFAAIGAVVYATVNVLGLYYQIGFFWLVGILIVALIFNFGIFTLFIWRREFLENFKKIQHQET